MPNRHTTGEITPIDLSTAGLITSGPAAEPTSFFDNLDALRLNPDVTATAGAREILSHIPVRKPNRTEFFRVNPNRSMQFEAGVFEDRDESEMFFVAPELREEPIGEWKPKLLVTAITRQGTLLLWPVPLPDGTGRRNAWTDTVREACELAKTAWVRMVADMSFGAYRVYQAEGQLSEPVWPEKSLAELLKLGFKDRVIDSKEHPVVRRLRGLT